MLRIENLQAGYKQGFSLRNISLSVQSSEITAVIGPNGSGKTTFIKGLCKEIPVEGQVFLNDTDLLASGINRRARCMAVVPQNVEKTDMSVWDYVLTGRTPYRKWYQLDYGTQDREEAAAALQLTGLDRLYTPDGLRKKSMYQLSGGERQLCALAKALCQKPQILLLDEPTANLDLARQISTLQKIKEITGQTGCHTILVIHDVNLAAAYCTHLVFFSKGETVCRGPVNEVFTKENMERIYQTPLCVVKHPVNGRNVILPA